MAGTGCSLCFFENVNKILVKCSQKRQNIFAFYCRKPWDSVLKYDSGASFWEEEGTITRRLQWEGNGFMQER